MSIHQNKTCLYCGKYIEGCTCKDAWRSIACSYECYIKYIELHKGDKPLNVIFRIETSDVKTDDILEADFENGIFKGRNKTYHFDDINTFFFSKKFVQNEIEKQKEKDKKVTKKKKEEVKSE